VNSSETACPGSAETPAGALNFNSGDSAHHGHIRRLVTLGERPAGLIKTWLVPQGTASDGVTAGSQFIDGLGSSEMGMALFGGVTTPETPRSDRNVGKPTEVVEHATILDDDGNELPIGAVGMLAVKAPSITPGYWKNPRLTNTFQLNGYWLTGDVARRDADGYFYHLDRTVDVIDTLAGPVYSLPIEEVLLADCDDIVQDCSVIGVPGHAGEGQRPIAVVCLQEDAKSMSEEAILERANKELADKGMTSLAAIRIVREPADFPLGPTGKVLKRELRTKWATLFSE